MKWEKFKLENLVQFRTGKLNSNASVINGEYPFFTCSREIFRTNTFSFDTEAVLLGGNNASADYPIFYFDGQFDAYQRTYVIEPINREQLHTRFLFYQLSTQLAHFKNLSIGAATKFLTLGLLNKIEIPLPPLPKQQKIASILSAYDDLIENNLKRIRLLEEAAQHLYQEWFVRFRFPGWEEAEFGADGVPVGWERRSVFEMAEVTCPGIGLHKK